MSTIIAKQSIQLSALTPGAGLAAASGNVRVEGTTSPGVRVTNAAGSSFEVNQALLDTVDDAVADIETAIAEITPTYSDGADWWAIRPNGAGTLVSIGLAAPVIVGTPSALAVSANTSRSGPTVNIAQAAATAGLAASVATPNYTLIDPIWNPELMMIVETRDAADMASFRIYAGFFSATPTNTTPFSVGSRHFEFYADDGNPNWYCSVNSVNGGSPVQTNTGVPWAANTVYKFRIKLTPTSVHYYIDNVLVHSTTFTAIVTPSPLGAAISHITTTATARKIGISGMMCKMKA